MHTILMAHHAPLFQAAMGRAVDAWANGHPEATCPREVMETTDLGRIFSLLEAQPGLDLILLDPHLSGLHGISGLHALCSAFPDIPVALIWDGQDAHMALQSVACGAKGILHQNFSSQQVDEAISRLLSGGFYLPPEILCNSPHLSLQSRNPSIVPVWLQCLSQRQLLVLARMCTGESNKQIAWSLGIAETTVKTHVSMILQKLGVHNRVQAILLAKDVDFALHSGPQPTLSTTAPALPHPPEPESLHA